MGWDVDAVYEGIPCNYVNTDDDESAAKAFRGAVQEVQATDSWADGNLENGGLDSSPCVRILAEYSGESDIFAVWDVAYTRVMHDTIKWPELAGLSKEERSPIANAMAFLRVCAEQGYGVQFDP